MKHLHMNIKNDYRQLKEFSYQNIYNIITQDKIVSFF
jgi:hypothetical protein